MKSDRSLALDSLIGKDLWVLVGNIWVQFVSKVDADSYKVHVFTVVESIQYHKYDADERARIMAQKTTMLFNCQLTPDIYRAIKNREILTTAELFETGE